MKLLFGALSAVWLVRASGFAVLPAAVSYSGSSAGRSVSSASSWSALRSSSEGLRPPSPDELRARAAEIREELKGLEEAAASTRRPNAELAEPRKVVPLPETLLDSCWKVVLELRGVKSDKNRVPVRLVFCCKFVEDDFILEVEKDHRFVKRGYVWEPDRNTVDNKEFITFIAQVEGLSAVPDGRIYMNAFIDTIKGEDGKNRYQFSDGAVTIKEVINQSFWGIFNTAGLLAQFKVVGTWNAFPIEALPEKSSST